MKESGAVANNVSYKEDDSSLPERTQAKATIHRLILCLSYQRKMGSNLCREVSRPKAQKKIDAFMKKAV